MRVKDQDTFHIQSLKQFFLYPRQRWQAKPREERGLSKQNLANMESGYWTTVILQLNSVLSLHPIENVTCLSCFPCRYLIPPHRIKMWFNGTSSDFTLPAFSTQIHLFQAAVPLRPGLSGQPYVHMLLLVWLHSASRIVVLCACWEKCCLNISWCKYGKWFVMAPESSTEFYIMSSRVSSRLVPPNVFHV